ncbi:MAG TPA: DUF4350 domain-containing protein [Terriglobales bacterium]|nr:DUF4350 domain-containing protein [Terriglobales bacterium]
MPLKVSPKDRKLFLGVALVFALMVVGGALFAGHAGLKAEIPTTYSAGSGGAKVAYLLLQESGYKVVQWRRTLSELDERATSTLILADPEEASTREDKTHLQKFIADGGHVIATGVFATSYLPEGSSRFDPVEGMLWKKLPALSPSAITRQAPEITMAPEAYWSRAAFAVPLYGEDDRVRVAKYNFGKGQVIWWASATPLTNAGLREAGNLEFLLACIGEGQREILWDEYIHGYRQSLSASIARSPLVWLVLQFSLLGAAVLFTFSRRSGPMFQPVGDVRLSPLEFVHTLGGLYERAGAGSVAVDITYQRFRYWLTRRLGLAGNASAADLQRAVEQRSILNDEHFAGTLRACESARYDTNLEPAQALQLIQELHEYTSRLKLFPSPRAEKEKA